MIEWIEPGDDGKTPVVRRCTAEEAASAARAAAAVHGKEYEWSSQAVEDFMVVNWAKWVDVLPGPPPRKTTLCGYRYRVEFQNNAGEWFSVGVRPATFMTYDAARDFVDARLEGYSFNTYRILCEPL